MILFGGIESRPTTNFALGGFPKPPSGAQVGGSGIESRLQPISRRAGFPSRRQEHRSEAAG
jgi:hypothetical protein